jgi:molybdopterin/thiamine biosynthesis adenylyltransferase
VGAPTISLGAGGSHEKLREVVVLIVSIKLCGGPAAKNKIINKIADINSFCLDV